MGKRHNNIKPGQKLVNGLRLHEDGFYRYRFMRKGKLETGKILCTERKQAEDELLSLKADKIKEERKPAGLGLGSDSGASQLSPITLGELVCLWELTKSNCSKSHRQTTAGSIRNHFAHLLDTLVERITTLEINQAMETYMNTKGVNPGRGGTPCLREHSARGANKVLRRLRDVVKFGKDEDRVGKVRFRIEFLKEEEVQKHTLPLKLMGKFFELIDRAKNPHLGLAARLMLWLGLREDEARNTTWEGINWDRNLCFPDKTKTTDGCGVAMPSELREFLRNHPDRKASGLMLPSARGTRHGAETAYEPGVTGPIIEAASWKVVFDELGPGDVERLFDVIDQHQDRDLRTLTRLMLYFGFPESMARSMRWENFDLTTGVYCWSDRGGTARVASIPPNVLLYLDKLPGDKVKGRIVSASMGRHKGNGEFSYGEATKAIAKAWKILRLPRLTPHRLRASFATVHATEFHTHISIIQKLMRHKQIATTLRYININDRARQEAQGAWPSTKWRVLITRGGTGPVASNGVEKQANQETEEYSAQSDEE